jgi:hypothetical protein
MNWTKRGDARSVNMYWKIGPDEALILDFDNHDGFWMLPT